MSGAVSFIFLCVLIGSAVASGPFVEECVSGRYPPKGQKPVASEVVNLDLPPQQRWNVVMKDKAPLIVDLLTYFKTFIKEWGPVGQMLISFVDSDMGAFVDTLPAPFGDEIRGIATATKLPLGEVVLYNIFYEIFTVCTSIVAQDPTGTLYHARNLDFGLFLGWNIKNHTWYVPDKLRPLIVNVDFQKGGKTIFKTVNFAGYVGVLTGIKPSVFTLTMNERFNPDGGFIGILQWIMGERGIHWMSFLTRNTLEHAANYTEAKSMLAKTPMLAPAYFILGGRHPGEGCVITRSRNKAVDIWNLDPKNGTWFLLETNYDHWEKPLFLDDRRTPGNKCMNKLSQKKVGIPGLFDVLSSRPVLNKLTTYTALMQVNKGTLETYLQHCPEPCPPW